MFKTSSHGFRFGNSFTAVPAKHPIPKLPQFTKRFGLCGGMSAAAIDWFVAKRQIPQVISVPAQGTPLYKYLFDRQLATFGNKWSYVYKFIKWMALPLNNKRLVSPIPGKSIPLVKGTRRRTREEFNKIVSEMRKGRPVVLGLVRVKATSSLKVWANHQVVAYSVQQHRDHRSGALPGGTLTATFSVYDPNHPRRNDIRIKCVEVAVGRDSKNRLVKGFRCEEIVPRGTGEPVRGLFLMSHARRTPPARL
jgi:hypothetical protein